MICVQWQRQRDNCVYFRESFSDLEWKKAYEYYLHTSLEWNYSRIVLHGTEGGDHVVLEENETR